MSIQLFSQLDVVRPEWIDYNGHMNVAYYLLAGDRAADAWFDAMDMGAAYRARAQCSFFTLESHVRYRRELAEGDPFSVDLRLLEVGAKRLRYVQALRHADAGWVAAAIETVSVHVDLATRRSAPLPVDLVSRLEEMRDAHADLPEQEPLI